MRELILGGARSGKSTLAETRAFGIFASPARPDRARSRFPSAQYAG